MSEFEKSFYGGENNSDKWEPYLEIYERYLSRYRDKDITIVEIGVQSGGSLDTLGRFLGKKAKIIGIDVEPKCADLKYTNSNISVEIGDQGDPAFWDNFLEKYPKIDVVIDDGGHLMLQQITSFEKVFPHINVGGVYIVEDCHTSYMRGYGAGLNDHRSFIEYSKFCVDLLHSEWVEMGNYEYERRLKIVEGLSGISFFNSMVVFEKYKVKKMQRVFSNYEQ